MRQVSVFFLAAMLAAAFLFSDEPEKEAAGFEFEDIEELNLDDLLNTTVSIATGKVQRIEEAPGIVSVITDEEIRRLGARTLEDVLKSVPGFEVLTDNSGLDRIVVRGVPGFTSQNVLLMYNGHRLNDNVTGSGTDVNYDIPLANIKKIEIIRGPGSALFGANAFVGVINLVTYSAETLDGLEVLGGGGSFATQDYSVQYGKTLGGVGLYGSLQFTDTDGAVLPVPADAQTFLDQAVAPYGIPPASRAPGFTESARRGLFADFRLSSPRWKAQIRIKDEDSDGYIGMADALGNGSLIEPSQINMDVSYTYPVSEKGSVFARVLLSRIQILHHIEVYPPGFTVVIPDYPPLTFPDGILNDLASRSFRFAGDLRIDYRLFEENNLTVGTSFESESTYDIETNANYDPVTLLPLPGIQPSSIKHLPDRTRDIASFFVQDTWNPGRSVGLTAGVRYDHYNDFGDTINPRAALVWRFSQEWNVKLLYGRAFRAPALFEMFVAIPGQSGSPDLRASTIHTLEAALGYSPRKSLRVGVNYFANYVRDYIELSSYYDPSSSESVRAVNGPGLDVKGVELELKAEFGLSHAVFANFTYQNPIDRRTGNTLHDVPKVLVNLGGTLGLGKYLYVSPTVNFRGQRSRMAGDPRPDVEGYGLLDITLQAKNLWETLEIAAIVQNALDTQYFDPSPYGGVPGDYPRAGRRVFLRASYKF